MSPSSKALVVESLQVGYGDLTVVWDASLAVDRGEVCVLRGRNGAGKTTLMSGIAGLLPATSGSVHLDGRSVSSWPAHKRAKHGIGLVQAGKRVFRELSVRDNLSLGAMTRASGRANVNAAILSMYDRFPLLGERCSDRAGSLSGGQQQLLAIAQALAAQPKVLLLDEPSSGLSPRAIGEVRDVIASVKDDGLAVLLVEELADDVYAELADTVLMLDQGRVVHSGAAGSLSRDDIMAALDLAQP
ncbi:ABC transporter ATP-binding protein [Nocardioides sp. NPDC051685]|uniref:ABC transporter ATP-binding protein n=1 Tax=Nocardioides sp. NPDC051685 TaxID=3364334 RepID=UPI003789ACD8